MYLYSNFGYVWLNWEGEIRPHVQHGRVASTFSSVCSPGSRSDKAGLRDPGFYMESERLRLKQHTFPFLQTRRNSPSPRYQSRHNRCHCDLQHGHVRPSELGFFEAEADIHGGGLWELVPWVQPPNPRPFLDQASTRSHGFTPLDADLRGVANTRKLFAHSWKVFARFRPENSRGESPHPQL